jgi:hypothetical protein
MWNVLIYSPGIQLKELKETAKPTSMRAGRQIRIENQSQKDYSTLLSLRYLCRIIIHNENQILTCEIIRLEIRFI